MAVLAVVRVFARLCWGRDSLVGPTRHRECPAVMILIMIRLDCNYISIIIRLGR